MKVQWIHKLICIYKIDLALKTNVKCHYTYILIWKVKWHIWINLLKLMCSILRYTEYINNTSIYMCGLRPYVCVSFSFYVLHWNTRVTWGKTLQDSYRTLQLHRGQSQCLNYNHQDTEDESCCCSRWRISRSKDRWCWRD